VGATPVQFGPGGVVVGGGETTSSPEAETEMVQSAAATRIDLCIFDIAILLNAVGRLIAVQTINRHRISYGARIAPTAKCFDIDPAGM
jgi:hypothetical protein